MLRAIYRQQQITLQKQLPGVFQFIDWLPVERTLQIFGKPITYESRHLAQYLGLEQLFVSFNGYWPERQAELNTCSFKELEAAAVLARVPKQHSRTLVLASAGNTGRAFATVCSALQIPLCLVIPESSLPAMWSLQSFHPHVQLITVGQGADYSDAIALAHLISQMDGFFPEGGAANVARRDGMGLTVLDAAVTLGRIPDHYFQAVGSGTGGIAAWEANLRLLEDGRFGSNRMKLHLAQNHPFTPLVDAWQGKSRTLPWISEAAAKRQISQVAAEVLTNRRPAYSLTGGLYEALVETNGEMYSITNAEAERAQILFEELEGIDISSASGVTTAALIQAVATGAIQRQDCILLNITSGGAQRLRQDRALHDLKPSATFSVQDLQSEQMFSRLETYLTFSA